MDDVDGVSAYSRFVLDPDRKDYNLDRILRLVALATGCRFAALMVRDETGYVPISVHGLAPEQLPRVSGRCDKVMRTGLPVIDSDVAEIAVSPGICARAGAAMPVFAADKSVIGVLCVFSDRPLPLDGPRQQRILVDCVRLIEDSLRLRQAAAHDPLTGLYNRRFLMRQLDTEWRRARRQNLPISLMLIDIDAFKRYNDHAGHLAGDEAIRRIAQIVQAHLRRAGDVVCRFGGEEFLVLMPATPPSAARARAELIRAAVEAASIPHPAASKGSGGVLTISVGVATARDQTELAACAAIDLVHAADQALYRAKRGGRNCVRRGSLISAPERSCTA